MTASSRLSFEDRSILRQFLQDRFNLSELKNLCFDLGVDYELFPHETKDTFTRELIHNFDRKGNLSCLIAEVLEKRPSDILVQFLAQLQSCSPRTKVQIVLPLEKLRDKKKMLSDLARVLGVSSEEVMLIAQATGSIRLLIGLPKEAAEQLLAEHPELIGEQYPVDSIAGFDDLPAEEQEAWRKIALSGPPPAGLLGLLSALPTPALVVVGVVAVVVILTVVVTVAAPQVRVHNRCADDIDLQEVVPVLGGILSLPAGDRRSFAIPPGDYHFIYNGRAIRFSAPLVGQRGPYPATGDVDASFEGRRIRAGEPLDETARPGGRFDIVLCPSRR